MFELQENKKTPIWKHESRLALTVSTRTHMHTPLMTEG